MLPNTQFEAFINASGIEGDNVNLATAFQLWGASEIMGRDTVVKIEERVLTRFDEAIKNTPYDPAAYNLRALAVLGMKRSPIAALADLERALELDSRNKRARALVQILDKTVNHQAYPSLQKILNVETDVPQVLTRIRSRFGIEASQ